MDLKNTKKPVRSALGRGLSALISSAPVPVAPHRMNVGSAMRVESSNVASDISTHTETPATLSVITRTESGDLVKYVSISSIINNPTQPRQEFDERELVELAESIKSLGVLQPILLRPAKNKKDENDADLYEVVAGERRWRASKLAGLEQVPVIIKEINDRQTLEIAIVENVQRSGLNPVEEAVAYSRLMSEFNLSHKEVADRVGKDRTSISNIVRILNLPEEIQAYIREAKLSLGHAKAILTIKEPSAQISLAKKVLNEGLSVRALEAIVGRVVVLDGSRQNNSAKGVKSDKAALIAFPELVDRMRNALGTKVSLKHTKSGRGKIEIEYFSEQELERVLEQICRG